LENTCEKRTLFLDSKCIKAHFNACGARGGNDKIGRTKGGINTKITVVCDINLNPIEAQVDSGNRSDMKIGEEIVDILDKRSILVADKGYDNDNIRTKLKKRKIRSIIPYRKNRKVIKKINKKLYK